MLIKKSRSAFGKNEKMSELQIGTKIEEELLDWTNTIIKIDWNKSNNKQAPVPLGRETRYLNNIYTNADIAC